MPKTRLAAPIMLGAVLLLAACGGDDGGAGTTASPATSATTATSVATTAPATTAASVATTAPTTTAAPATSAAPAVALCPGASAPAGGASAVEVSLIEWEIKAPAIKAGDVAITIKNTASADHELLIIKGDSFASLPKKSNGAVDEAALPAGSIIGQAFGVRGNKSCLASVTLPAGKYVFMCNINSGPNSHAAKGQKLDVTVA